MTEYMTIGKKEFAIGKKPYIMGILNVTPDSFSDGGKYTDVEKALLHVRQMMDEGADIIDVGGESTRPGHTPVSIAEEIERTCFVIEAIKENYDIPISLDTYKWQVAQAGILAGADMINDIWGFKQSEKMAELVAKTGVACCLVHNRAFDAYDDFVNDVVKDLTDSVAIAVNAGISRDKIMIDPGVGFAKNYEENLSIMRNVDRLLKLELPVLLATSNKSVIGNTLNLDIGDRLEGTMATSVMGLVKGCSFFRVHDVKANYRALSMAWAIEHQL